MNLWLKIEEIFDCFCTVLCYCLIAVVILMCCFLGVVFVAIFTAIALCGGKI